MIYYIHETSTTPFSSGETKMISDAMKEIVEKYNGPLREKAIKSIESSYNENGFRFIKFICTKASESNKFNQLFRVVPYYASWEYKSACINIMQDMAHDLYNKIKNNIKNINCDVWDSEDETELLVGCIRHG